MINRQRIGVNTLYVLAIFWGLAFLLPSFTGASDDFFGTGEETEEVSKPLTEVFSAFSFSSAQAGRTYPAAAVINIEPGWHINSSSPHQDWLIPLELAFDTVAGLTPHNILYPPGKDVLLIGETMSVLGGRVIIYYQIDIAPDAPEGDIALPTRVSYQLCNDKECRPPETVEIDLLVSVGDEGQPLADEIFSGVEFPVETSGASGGDVSEESDIQRLIEKYGFWGYFLALGIAFITGLLLSFSPCTYPMIPITVSVFAGQDRTMGRGFVLSLFYVGSMAVVYGIMGLIVSLVGGVFGAWLASPPVVIGMAVIFVIFALSMFGLFELNVPASIRQKMGATKSRGGVIGSIILGIVAALVISPCVGPFVAGILIYIATHGSPIVGFLVLFVFALGLGTLFVIIGTFSSAINALPRAGEWMETVRRFFGFVLLLMALYFLQTIISPTLTAVLFGIVLIALGIFGGGLDRLTAEASIFFRLKKFIGILALLFGIYFLMGTAIINGLLLPPASEWLPMAGSGNQQANSDLIPWETDLEAGLARARAEGKPVLIDTWATWCVNCKVLDRKTFNNPDVAAEARRFVPLKIQLESANSPATKQFMARFGWKTYSLPTTVILDASGETRFALRGVVGPDEMIGKLREVK
jgi:thiol:disulfide interchange protein DsbD